MILINISQKKKKTSKLRKSIFIYNVFNKNKTYLLFSLDSKNRIKKKKKIIILFCYIFFI